MPYPYKIKFAAVSNLTSARYAAAMEADYIGFCFDQQSQAFITVEKAKEIIQWCTGVSFIGEFRNKPVDEIFAIAAELQLDGVELCGNYSDAELNLLNGLIIMRIGNVDDYRKCSKLADYFIAEFEATNFIPADKLFLDYNPADNSNNSFHQIKVTGININALPEELTGIIDFEPITVFLESITQERGL